eukprot:376608-Hanusia_phi.AAC.1
MAGLDAQTDLLIPRSLSRDPVDALDVEASPRTVDRVVLMSDSPCGGSQPLPLSYGVEPKPPMLPQLPACVEVDDRPRVLSKVMPDKVLELELPKEADALTILALLCREVELPCQLSHLLLGIASYGEQSMLELLLPQVAEEVSLVLDLVRGHQQPRDSSLLVVVQAHSIVSRCHSAEVLPYVLLEHAELDPAVAHDVGVRGPTQLRLPDEVVHHLLPVLLLQRDRLNGNIKSLCH